MRIYIAGKMTGEENFGFPAFFEMAGRLNQAGYETENPADNDGPDLDTSLRIALEKHGAENHTWADYMRRDIPRVLKCDAIVVLPNWRQSKGACWEVDIARKLGMPVYRFDKYELKPLVEIISLSGYATSGKDTASELLAPYGWKRVSFADKLRECLYALNPYIPMSNNDLYDFIELKDFIDKNGWQRAKIESVEIRRLLQHFGTEVGREILGENIWVEAAFRGLQDGGQFVFTDTRFPNELEAVKEYNAKTIWITRHGVGPVNNHASDNSLSLSDCDYEVKNDGNKNDLLLQLLDIV